VNQSRRGVLRSTFEVSAVETAASVPTLGRAKTGCFASALIASPLASFHGDRVSPTIFNYWRRHAAIATRERVSRVVVTNAYDNRYWPRMIASTPVRGADARARSASSYMRIFVARKVAVLM
jgi:hypothetical protein